MDGWMDGWMAGWVGGWVDGWMDGWMDVQTSGPGFATGGYCLMGSSMLLN